MSSKVTVNIGDGAIVVPDTDANVPDTGVFSTGQISDSSTYTTVLPIIGASIIILTLLAIVIRLCIKRIKDKRHSSNFKIHNAGRSLLRLTSIALIVTLSTLAFINYNTNNKEQAEALETRDSNSLSITTEDINIKVVMEDEPVFAMSENKIKVDTATSNGYKVLAYIDSDSADLVSTTDNTAKISNLDSAFSQVLTENTWGMSIVTPENQDQAIYRGIPAGVDNAIPVRVTGDTATEANDTTTIYYVTYVTPELDYGMYTGASVNYIAVANVVTDDITVNYHSYYDSEHGTTEKVGNRGAMDALTFEDGSTLNTVVYGNNCSLGRIDVSGDCETVYAGNNPRISKTANIDNSGLADGNYSDDLVQVDPITFTGADLLKVELSYATEQGCDTLYVFDRTLSNNEITSYESSILRGADVVGEYSGGWNEQEASMVSVVLYIEGDAMTFAFLTDGSVTGYGYFAKVTPIYFERPSGTSVVESTLCRIAKSDNMDDDGNVIKPLFPDDVNNQIIIIPGADKVRVNVEYNIASDIGFNVGGRNYLHEFISEEKILDGSDTLDFNGDMATFANLVRDILMPVSRLADFGTGFYAEVYPIYDEETENTLLTETCPFERKDGDYKETARFEYWVMELDGPIEEGDVKYLDWDIEFYNEYDVMSFLDSHRNYFKGRTVDLYAVSYAGEN